MTQQHPPQIHVSLILILVNVQIIVMIQRLKQPIHQQRTQPIHQPLTQPIHQRLPQPIHQRLPQPIHQQLQQLIPPTLLIPLSQHSLLA
ncbi:hypothetical protein H6768_02740 [Candidatus Peribacteria bacterium]|nr:hypothetical protein [Candidatus Peribacteria bacterium]